MNMHASVDDWLKLSDAFLSRVDVDRHEGEGAGDLGHRRRPRAQQCLWRDALPAQHRARRRARSGADASASASATAEQVRATGITWAFAPTLAVVQNPRWGRTYESYSSDPAAGARLWRGDGAAAFRASSARSTSVLATAKHYLGDGGTFHGKDQGETRTSEAEPRPHPRRRLLRRAQGERADGDGELFELHRHRDRQALGQDARQRPSRRRRAEEAARLRRAGRQRLERHRAGAGLHQVALPAGDQRRDRPGHGPRRLEEVHRRDRSRTFAPAGSR